MNETANIALESRDGGGAGSSAAQLGPSQVYRELAGARRWLAAVGYPGIIAIALAGAWTALDRGVSVLATTATVVVGAALGIWALERVQPYTTAWHPTRNAFFVDLVHSLVSANAVAPLVRGAALGAATWLGAAAAGAWGVGIWPSDWPLAAQVALGIVVADLGAYAGHRFMHVTRMGWSLHAVHHSAERLYFLASGRAHPFNAVLTLTLETLPVVVLGITPEALVLMTVFKAVNGMLQHSNVDLRPGFLSHVIATNDVHRWHHSRELDESNTNFGNTTMLWDQLFGTFFLPKRVPPRAEVGIAGSAIPERYLSHLVTPFVLDRYESHDPS